jgi:hypothetical protein
MSSAPWGGAAVTVMKWHGLSGHRPGGDQSGPVGPWERNGCRRERGLLCPWYPVAELRAVEWAQVGPRVLAPLQVV